MPARLSSMELSSPSNPDVDPSARPSRRKSGRVPKKPEFLSPGASSKRKRDQPGPDSENANEDVEMDDASEDVDEDDPDEEELREQRRKKKRVRKDHVRPSVKERKTPNGVPAGSTSTLVRRPAKKPVKSPKGHFEAAEDVGGLYGMCI